MLVGCLMVYLPFAVLGAGFASVFEVLSGTPCLKLPFTVIDYNIVCDALTRVFLQFAKLHGDRYL